MLVRSRAGFGPTTAKIATTPPMAPSEMCGEEAHHENKTASSLPPFPACGGEREREKERRREREKERRREREREEEREKERRRERREKRERLAAASFSRTPIFWRIILPTSRKSGKIRVVFFWGGGGGGGGKKPKD